MCVYAWQRKQRAAVEGNYFCGYHLAPPKILLNGRVNGRGERERERLLPVKKLCHEEYNKKKKKKHSVIREGWKVVQRFHDHKKKKEELELDTIRICLR